jgi:threonine synthase
MEEHVVLRCANCGNEWEPQGLSLNCPVCGFPAVAEMAIDSTAIRSIADLEAQLSALLLGARASGLDPDEVVRVLRDELEFAAELAHAGRRLYVQLLDLGPQEADMRAQPTRNRGATLRGRGVGAG